jgi:hypothetical protein
MPAPTATPLAAVLADQQPHRWQVEHLARLLADQFAVSQIASVAATDSGRVHDHLVGLLDALKAMTLVAMLTARLAARPAAQTLRRQRLPARPSDDGDELREFCASRRFRSATSARNSTINAARSTTSPSNNSPRDNPPPDT